MQSQVENISFSSGQPAEVLLCAWQDVGNEERRGDGARTG